MTSTADLQQIATSAGPWFGLALALLGIAAQVARSQRRSAIRQGERIGELERRADSERDRRQQVEAVLLGEGIPLPYWPADGPNQPRRPRRSFEPYSGPGPWAQDGVPLPGDVDEDSDDDYAMAPRPPVPPFPPTEAAKYARHARPRPQGDLL